MEVVASISQGRTAAAQCGLFTHKSVPVIFEPPCIKRTEHYVLMSAASKVFASFCGSSVLDREWEKCTDLPCFPFFLLLHFHFSLLCKGSEISSSHIGVHEYLNFVECFAMSTGKLLWTFRCILISIFRVKQPKKLELSRIIPFDP